jgi:hypothetical protein
MRNSFTPNGLYRLSPQAIIVDFDLGQITTSLKLRRKEYAQNGYGELDYASDPIIVQAEMFLVENEKGERRLVESPDDMHHSENVTSLVWVDTQSNHMTLTSVNTVELLAEW